MCVCECTCVYKASLNGAFLCSSFQDSYVENSVDKFHSIKFIHPVKIL